MSSGGSNGAMVGGVVWRIWEAFGRFRNIHVLSEFTNPYKGARV
jgi:hypothetical protein